MPTVAHPRTKINPSIVYNLRQSGATLQQIADKIAMTKEGVRRILISNYGSTRHGLISTQQLSKLAGLTPNRVVELYQGGVIIPVVEWDMRGHHYRLWSSDTVEQSTSYSNTHRGRRLCRMCHRPIVAKGNWVFCSKQCYEENHKYKYKSAEAKKRHMRSITKYRAKQKKLAQAPRECKLEVQPIPLGVR